MNEEEDDVISDELYQLLERMIERAHITDFPAPHCSKCSKPMGVCEQGNSKFFACLDCDAFAKGSTKD